MVSKKWSKFWKSSVSIRKQRKYVYNAPLHVKHKMLSAGLSKELKSSYGFRTIPVRKGDTVKIISGGFKNKSGKISKVMLARGLVYIEGIEQLRADGSKAMYPIHPSNLQIIKLDLSDKRRVKKIERLKSGK
ncbi:MAG: 50S ribosomal protein L24 [Nanoarchaeota archaeon]